MKISSLLVSIAVASKKRGNSDLSKERFIWQTPLCVTRPDSCTNRETITSESGSITLSPNDYSNMNSRFITINPGQNRKVWLKFDTDYGFEMEYHKACGYDKLHIYSGTTDDFESAKRLARWCGPKNTDGGKPWDGSRKLKNSNGTLPMWDTEVDTQSNYIFVAVDLDQDIDGLRGFKLNWRSEPTGEPSDFEIMIGHWRNYVRRAIKYWRDHNVVDGKWENRYEKFINKILERAKIYNKCQDSRFDEMTIEPAFLDGDNWDDLTYSGNLFDNTRRFVCGRNFVWNLRGCPKATNWQRRCEQLPMP